LSEPPNVIIILIVMKLKLRAVGTSTGILLPKEMLVRMKLKKNDNIFAVETPEGYLLTPYDPEVEEQVSKGREFMSKYRETFRALAK
jgi:putative addiction module antidote